MIVLLENIDKLFIVLASLSNNNNFQLLIKSNALLHMSFTKDFRTGMNEYLTKFAYKNAATEDLWESLSAASGKPVDMVMSTWTEKMGYPVLTVTAKQVCSIYHYV